MPGFVLLELGGFFPHSQVENVLQWWRNVEKAAKNAYWRDSRESQFEVFDS